MRRRAQASRRIQRVPRHADVAGQGFSSRSARREPNEEATARGSCVCGHIPPDTARKPSRERETKSRALVVRVAGCTPSYTRIEDTFVVSRGSWAVILDRVDDARVPARDRDADVLRSVPARIFQDWLQD